MPETQQQAKEQVQQAAGQVQDKAQEATHQAKGRLREQVDTRSTDAGEKVSTTAEDIRTVGNQLREQGKDQPAKLADQAANQAEKLGGYLKRSDADRILGDIEDFGRRQPLAVAAAGLALGFAASRFLKASSSERYQASRRPGEYPATSPGQRVDAGAIGPAYGGANGGDGLATPVERAVPVTPAEGTPSVPIGFDGR